MQLPYQTETGTQPFEQTYVETVDLYAEFIDATIEDVDDPIATIAEDRSLSETVIEDAVAYVEEHAAETVRERLYDRIHERRHAVKADIDFDTSLTAPERQALRAVEDEAYRQFQAIDARLLDGDHTSTQM